MAEQFYRFCLEKEHTCYPVYYCDQTKKYYRLIENDNRLVFQRTMVYELIRKIKKLREEK